MVIYVWNETESRLECKTLCQIIKSYNYGPLYKASIVIRKIDNMKLEYMRQVAYEVHAMNINLTTEQYEISGHMLFDTRHNGTVEMNFWKIIAHHLNGS